MTAQGNALGTENGHESKPCKGEIGKVGGTAIGRDLFHDLYAALSGLGWADHPHYDPLLQTAEELQSGKRKNIRIEPDSNRTIIR